MRPPQAPIAVPPIVAGQPPAPNCLFAILEFLSTLMNHIRPHLKRIIFFGSIVAILVCVPWRKHYEKFELSLQELRIIELQADDVNMSVGSNFWVQLAATKKKGEFSYNFSRLAGSVFIDQGEWTIETQKFQLPPWIKDNPRKVFWNLSFHSTIYQEEKKVAHLKEQLNLNNTIPITLTISGIDSQDHKFETKCSTSTHPSNFPPPVFSVCQTKHG